MPATAVFITSPSLTGTTMLSLILGSLPNAFNCGEPAYLFHDKWKNLDVAWKDTRQNFADRSFWSEIQAEGFDDFFPAIHNRTGANLIIDSSNEQWAKFALPQHKILTKSNLLVKDILIWKTPLEQAYSYHKRGRDVLEWFDNRWLTRMELFFANVKDPLIIRYRDVAVESDSILSQICDALNTTYDPEIKKFWLKRQPCLWGNKNVIKELHEAWVTGVHPRGGIIYDDGWKQLPSELKQKIRNRNDINEWTDKLDALSLKP